MAPRSLLCFCLLAACGHPHDPGDGPDGGLDDGALSSDGAATGDGDLGDAGGSGSGSASGSTIDTTCDANHWLAPIAVTGPSVLRFHDLTRVWAPSGTAWATVDHATGVATTSAIPLPAGATFMKAVKAELGLDGKPLIWYLDANNHYYATRFDGAAFSAPIDLAGAATIHADAAGDVLAYGPIGLVEYPAGGGASIARGTWPVSDVLTWNVGPDGTVYLLEHVRRPSTIHPGDQADDMLLMHLPHGSLTWSAAQLVASNEGYGFYNAGLATAPDGSLHVAYVLGGVYYFRSRDGVTWDTERASDFTSQAVLVDYAPADDSFDPPDHPADVDGWIHLIAAHDYDHVVITLDFPTSSLYTSSYYQLRRCMPFQGFNMVWPAERFAFSESWTGEASIDEHGLASIMTPLGLRVDVAP
jgi:hypothetical protein